MAKQRWFCKTKVNDSVCMHKITVLKFFFVVVFSIVR